MKILIISYYFEPCVGIAPNRPTAFATNFSKNHDVKVITRHWEGNENKWEDYLGTNSKDLSRNRIHSQLEIIRTPYISKIQKRNQFRSLLNLILGKLDPEIDSLQFLSTANNVIAKWKPEIIFVSAPPLNIVHLAYKLSQKHQIPFYVDFRDFENHILLNKNQNRNLKETIFHKFRVYHTLKWLKKSNGLSTINEELQNYFSQKTKLNSSLIYNGYEETLFNNFIPLSELKSDKFIVSIIGTIYPGQELELFLNAFRSISFNESKILFKFIGVDTIPEIGNQIRHALKPETILITGRISRDLALKHLEESHLVWHPEWKNHVGMYSGKIFEYLGAKRIIIVAPSVGDVLDKLLFETNAGYSLNTSKEITSFIQDQYDHWFQKGHVYYTGNSEIIAQYSRENQSTILLDILNKSI